MKKLTRAILISAVIMSGVRLVAQNTAPSNPIPTALLVTQVNNITATSQYVDNRSSQRQNTYHSFCATGTGSWSATIQYNDTTPSGSWTSFSGPAATVTNSSSNCIGAAYGNHLFIRFSITGSVAINYTGQNSLYINPSSASSGLTVGSTTISGGTPGYNLYDNSGILGEHANNTGTVTSITLAGTGGQITVTGTCTITATGTCTFSLPSNVVLPGTINSLTLTTSTGTITLTNAKTFTVTNTLTFGGTDSTTINFPNPSSITNNDCVAWTKSGSTIGFADAGAACGSGGGGTSPSQYCAPTISGAVETLFATATTSTPCILTSGNVPTIMTGPLTVTLGGTSDTSALTGTNYQGAGIGAYLLNGAIVVVYNSSVMNSVTLGTCTGTATCGTSSVTAPWTYPTGAVLIATDSYTANAFATPLNLFSANSNLNIQPGTGMAAFTLNPSTGTIIINAASSSAAVTDSIQFPAASIANGAAYPLWDGGTAGGLPGATGMGGSFVNPAVLQFGTAGTSEARIYYRLPSTWTGTISITFGTESLVPTTVNTISVKTACAASGGVYISPTYNAAQTVNVTANASAAVITEATISTLTTTGCSAGNILMIDIIKTDTNANLFFAYASLSVQHT